MLSLENQSVGNLEVFITVSQVFRYVGWNPHLVKISGISPNVSAGTTLFLFNVVQMQAENRDLVYVKPQLKSNVGKGMLDVQLVSKRNMLCSFYLRNQLPFHKNNLVLVMILKEI